jgi:hypothetical protein
MLRKCVMLACVLVLGCSGAASARPGDSPGTVYVGGLPCSSLCLSYLAWSHAMSSTHRQGRPLAMATRGKRIRGAGSNVAARAGVAKAIPVAANSNQMPRATIADPHPKAVAAAGPDAETIREQVRAALQVTATAAPAPDQKASNADGSDHPEAVLPADAQKAAATSPNDTDLLIVLVMARPEIRSVSDLASKTIAIDDAQSASNDNVRAAMVAAGAAEAELSGGETKALDRLIDGGVPAAVLAVVSPEAALRFPDIAGFKIFQVLLLRRSVKAAADTPEVK